MSHTNDTPLWNLRRLFQAVRDAIPPKPAAELPLMRHQPLDSDSDTAFWSDLRYLHDLREAIYDELDAGAFLWEQPIPVEGVQFFADWKWPADEAGTLLKAWRMELDLAAAA